LVKNIIKKMNFLKYLDEKIEKLKPLLIYLIPFTLALLIRTFAIIMCNKFLPWHSAFSSDSFVYLQQAKDILMGRWDEGFPNGYPLIIALFSFFPDRETAALILNIVLSSLIAGFTSFIVYKRTGSKLPALIAGIIVACWYNQIEWSTLLLSEAPSTFFLVLGILLIMRKKEYSGSFAIGFASLIRTTLLPIGLLIALFYRSRKIFLGFLIPVVLMMGVGYYFTGSFSVSGDNYMGANLYFASHISPDGQPVLFYPAGTSTGEAMKIYVDSFFKEPIKFIGVRAQQFWLFWGFWPLITGHHNALVAVVLKIIIGLRFPLLVLGLFFFFISKEKNRVDALFLIPIFVITAIHTLFFGLARYNYTVEPLLIALFISHLYFFLQDKRLVGASKLNIQNKALVL